LRNLTEVFIEHLGTRIEGTESCNPERELEHYDLDADPFQLRNLYPANSAGAHGAQVRLFARLEALRNCAGIEGRGPLPVSGHYCD
jgi:hypothetical protein